jgi:Na+-transporting NADH:ubiquinone oxidoreductase subunit NqrB
MTDLTVTTRSTASRFWKEGRLLDPRYLIAFLITLVLVAAEFRFQAIGGYQRLGLALLTCMATEAALSWFIRGKVVNLQSAYISGISLTLLLKPAGAVLWPFVMGGFLAISSKYVLRYRDQHLWNPTNFAITVLLLAMPARVSILSQQWGNDLATNLVIWGFGLIIASRVKVLHITLTYVASFFVLNGARALLLGQPLAPELAPITGPMYQLFIFFMITDPRTVVRGKRKQMAVVVAVALVETVIRLAADGGVNLPTAFYVAPPFLALAMVGPLAKWWDVRRQTTRA